MANQGTQLIKKTTGVWMAAALGVCLALCLALPSRAVFAAAQADDPAPTEAAPAPTEIPTEIAPTETPVEEIIATPFPPPPTLTADEATPETGATPTPAATATLPEVQAPVEESDGGDTESAPASPAAVYSTTAKMLPVTGGNLQGPPVLGGLALAIGLAAAVLGISRLKA